MIILKRSPVLLAILLTCSVALAKKRPPKPVVKINPDTIIDIIGENIPRCKGSFLQLHPNRAAEIERVNQSLLEVVCGDNRMTGIYLDTPSGRLVLTAEHAASGYTRDKNGTFKLSHTYNPSKCRVVDPTTRKTLRLDKNFPPRVGHPYDKLDLDGTTDWMLMVLAKPPKHIPLTLGHPDVLKKTTELLSSGLLALVGPHSTSCVNFTTCHAHTAVKPESTNILYLNTDCSGGPGNSGGPVTMQDENGSPLLIGIFLGVNVELKQGSPWDEEHMHASTNTISGKILETILQTEADLRGIKL